MRRIYFRKDIVILKYMPIKKFCFEYNLCGKCLWENVCVPRRQRNIRKFKA